MASSKLSSTTLFLTLNLLFFMTMVNSQPLPTCPLDIATLNVCYQQLSVFPPGPPPYPCCTLIQDLVDLEAAVCLCAALRANVLGIITIDLNLALTLILNNCGKDKPRGYVCKR